MTPSGPKNQSILLRIAPANTYIQPYEKIEDYGKKECVRENKRSREVIL